jgi:hypothetical protein
MIPHTHWMVEYSDESNEKYEFKLTNKATLKSRKFYLNRKKQYSQSGKWVYFFSENGKNLNTAITPDYIGNINNFLSALGTLLQNA